MKSLYFYATFQDLTRGEKYFDRDRPRMYRLPGREQDKRRRRGGSERSDKERKQPARPGTRACVYTIGARLKETEDSEPAEDGERVEGNRWRV